MIDWYELCRYGYKGGYYNTDPTSPMYLGNFVLMGKISPEEYEQITGKPYEQ